MASFLGFLITVAGMLLILWAIERKDTDRHG